MRPNTRTPSRVASQGAQETKFAGMAVFIVILLRGAPICKR